MESLPQVSIVVTCYNYGHYIDGCLRSIFDQTYTDYEIIIVDDGSTDATARLVEKYQDVEKLRYIGQKNSGQANAKNRGIGEARGEFVAFLDADDLWRKDKLEKQMRLFDKTSVGVVFSRTSYIDEHGEKMDFTLSGKYLQPRSGRVSGWLFLDNFVPFSSSVVRRECFAALGLFDESLSMGIDWDLWLRLSTQFEFDYVDEPLLAYRMGHPGQMSKNIETRQACSDRIMVRFLARYPGVVDTETIRKAKYYTLCNRGAYFSGIDRRKAYTFFLKAIQQNPLDKRAYKGIVKCFAGL